MSIEEQLFKKNKERILKSLQLAKNTPYYAKLFSVLKINVDELDSYDAFKLIPIMTKNIYKENYIDCIINGLIDKETRKKLNDTVISYAEKDVIVEPLNLEIYITSGSTGIPLEIIRHSRDMKKNYTILNKYRKSKGGLMALGNYIWVLPESYVSRKYVFNQDEPYFKQNSYGYIACIATLSDKELLKFINFIYTKKITAIISWPSFLVRLSQYVNKNNAFEYIQKIQYLECNSEPLFDWQVDIIYETFQLHVSNVYSGNETNFISATCSKNKMHLFDDNVFLELVENEWGVKETIVTNLSCDYTTLIRYNLGDVAEWDTSLCSCEMSHKYKINLKNYRSNDMVIAKNGNKYEFNIISDPLHFAQIKYSVTFDKYKVVQNKVDEFILYIGVNDSPKDTQKVVDYFKSYLEQVLKYTVSIIVIQRMLNWEEFNFSRKYRYFECQI